MLEFLRSGKLKKEAQEIVISSELLAFDTGLNAIDLISQYKGDNFYIKEIIKRYKENKPKYVVYEKIFDKDFLTLLKMTEEKGLSSGELFRDYAEIKEKSESAKKKLHSAIMYPFISYFITSLIVFLTISHIINKLGELRTVDLSSLIQIKMMFWPIIIGVALLILIPLLKFPHKIPVLKNGWRELIAFQLLGLIYLILKSGLSMVDLFDMMKKDKKFQGKIKKVEDIFKYLAGYLRGAEAFALQAAIQSYRYDKIIQTLLFRKKESFESIINKTTGALSSLSIIVVLIPVSFMLFTMFKLYSLLGNVTNMMR